MGNIICLECGWVGDSTELHSKTEDDDDLDFIHCPECGKKDCFEDEDTDEEDQDE